MLVGNVDLALINTVTGNEEGGFCIMALEKIKNMASESLVRAIIIGESNSSRCDTSKDTSATVWDGANFGTRNRRGVGTAGRFVLGAARAILELASRRVAEIICRTADCNLSAHCIFDCSHLKSYSQIESNTGQHHMNQCWDHIQVCPGAPPT